MDGRIKPDISAHGAGQISTDPGHIYAPFGGTSAAAPGIAGVVTQLHQAYRDLNNGEIAEAPLLKACILNTANDIGNKGPDFKFGWGQVNALRAARLLEEGRYFDATIEQGGINTHTINIPDDGVVEARIMVYWLDKDALAMAGRALVNNLNAELTAPGGSTTYLPWILDPTPDPALLDTPATTGEDNLNNVEQIAIEKSCCR